jgi:hypothetical protein
LVFIVGVFERDDGGDPFAVDGGRDEGFEACCEDGFGELGIAVDEVVEMG